MVNFQFFFLSIFFKGQLVEIDLEREFSFSHELEIKIEEYLR